VKLQLDFIEFISTWKTRCNIKLTSDRSVRSWIGQKLQWVITACHVL